ncbi:MAG: ABC transporter permease, partial [Phycisphaerae bacterium]
VRSGEAYAGLNIPVGALTNEAKAELIRESDKLTEAREIEHLLDEAVVVYRFTRHEPPLDREMIRALETSVNVDTINVRTGERGRARDMTRVLMPFAFMFLLWMGTFGISQGLLTSVIEEKSSRVVEVLLSAVSPMQLMSGKIIGMVMVGVLLIGVWLSVAYFAMDATGNAAALSGSRVWLFVAYYIPSFLFYSAILAGIGAAFNTLKEAQAMITPFTLITVIPMMLWFFVSNNPQSIISVAASFIVPITPFIMILRICADSATPMWQIVATLALLWISAFLAMWVAAKIFRVGVLMYGKPPTPREMIRWMGYS